MPPFTATGWLSESCGTLQAAAQEAALAREQAARHPAVLAQHGVGVLQRRQRAWREIAEIADRRRDEHQARRRRTTGRIHRPCRF